ncbi:double-strand break repair helicase AddA [Hyphomonas sp.]|uniref:double-strand break repair helicase AddA n=1 Tax=Hyphomonas sp. TaxID=87 RepID=UPI003527CC0D
MSDIVQSPDTEDFRKAVQVQARSADPMHSAFVMANAGSGKTKVLIDRVARLLLRRPDGRPGAKPDSILCITYTKAAASEMLSRLFKTLGQWSVMEDDPLRKKLAQLQGRKVSDYNAEDLQVARALFANALETPGGLRIETIHAFCARVLRRFPLEAGVFPGFTEIEEDDAFALWNEARSEAVMAAQEAMPDLLDLLALEGGHEGAMLALDTLRSIGTAVLRFAEHHDGDLGTMDDDLRDRLNAPEASVPELLDLAMGEALPEADIRTVAELLLTGAKTDLATGEKLMAVLATEDAGERWALYRSVFRTASGDLRASNPYTKGMSNASPLVAGLFQMKDGLGEEAHRMVELEDRLNRAAAFTRTSAMIRVGLPALERYRELKRARAALDFDDLIEHTRFLLTATGMSDWVLYKLDGGLSHLLLDEAQDTSPTQWELVDALTGEFDAGQGIERAQDPRTLFVVGDEKQSIYSFQGADPSQLLKQYHQFQSRNSDLLKETMEMSFRSGPEVLEYVDTVWNEAPPIPNAPADVPPEESNLVHHVSWRSNQNGSIELWPIPPKEEEKEEDAWARPVNAMRSSSPKARLATDVAKAVRSMIDAGESIWAETDGGWGQRPVRPEDILILVRGRTGGLFDAMIGALKAQGLPVAGADRLKLGDHIGVQDCLNLMRFAALPERDLTLAEILRGPFLGLVDDDRYLFELANGRKRGETLWQRVQASTDPDIQVTAEFLQGLIDNAHLPPFDFLTAVLDVPGADGTTGWEKLNARLGHPARDPVEALIAEAIAFDSTEPASLQCFVARMEAGEVEIKRDLAAPEREIRVMTVHGAKGLQAPVVILPDTTSAPKPSGGRVHEIDGVPVWSPRRDGELAEVTAARALADARAEEEHRRLLYVALTRAQDRLIIAGHWFGRDGSGGYHDRSWYSLCLNAMDKLVPAEGEARDEIRRFGVAPVMVPKGSQADEAKAGYPGWALEQVKDTPVTARRKFSAPTSLLGRDMPVMAPFGEGREARLKRGRLIHALLQYLPDVAEADREAAGRNFLARDASLDEAEREEMLSAALGVLQDPAMAGVFAPGGRAEAAIIGTSKKYLPEGVVINGRVDRLVVSDKEVLIVDFKTDQPAPDTPEGVGDSYMLQMAVYWAVLKEAYEKLHVRAALCWTDGPKLMPLPEEMLLASLNRAGSEV